jgi:hypothetical protein
VAESVKDDTRFKNDPSAQWKYICTADDIKDLLVNIDFVDTRVQFPQGRALEGISVTIIIIINIIISGE